MLPSSPATTSVLPPLLGRSSGQLPALCWPRTGASSHLAGDAADLVSRLLVPPASAAPARRVAQLSHRSYSSSSSNKAPAGGLAGAPCVVDGHRPRGRVARGLIRPLRCSHSSSGFSATCGRSCRSSACPGVDATAVSCKRADQHQRLIQIGGQLAAMPPDARGRSPADWCG